jgi:hypothetical protein
MLMFDRCCQVVKSKVKVKVPRIRSEGLEGGRGIAVPFLDLGTRRGGWSAPRPGRFTPRKDPVPIVQEAGWAPGPVWPCAKNLAPTGIRPPDRPDRSHSLYRLSYRPPQVVKSTPYILHLIFSPHFVCEVTVFTPL